MDALFEDMVAEFENVNMDDDDLDGGASIPPDDIDGLMQSHDEETTSSKTVRARISEQTLKQLDEMRQNSMLTDGIVTVSDASFHVHRAILSSCSSYFRAQFTSFSTAAQGEENRDVFIPGMRGEIMEQLLQYAYLRRCTINEDNVHELLASADYIGMVGLVCHCKEFLGEILSPENCVNIMGFARFRFLDDLYAKARSYLLKNFTEVAVKNHDILEIGLKDFYDIISDDELNTKDEDQVWRLCLKWIDYDAENRKRYLPQLMKGVRFGLMSPEQFIQEVKENPYVLECDEVKNMVIETLSFMYALDVIDPLDEREVTTPAIAIPRLPHEVIFAIGGWSGGTSKGCIETYDTRADRWINIDAEDPAGPRAYHGTAVIGFKIYCIGGYDGVVYFNTCRVFDAVRKTWHEIAPMHSRRCYVSVAELNGLIYAIGGFDGHNRLNTVERYNPRTNQWTIITPMNMQRSDASACALKGRIFTTGGFNGQECLDSAEYYDPKTNVWTRIPSMNHRRSGVSCVAYRGQLYVIGGFNGLARLSTGERYDPETESWSFIREMCHARSNFGLEIIDDMIFAIGGFNGVSTIAHTECYVAETDEWMEATDMNLVRSALTANVIVGLPNKRDYIHQNRARLMEERRLRLFPAAVARAVTAAAAQNEVPMEDYGSGEEDAEEEQFHARAAVQQHHDVQADFFEDDDVQMIVRPQRQVRVMRVRAVAPNISRHQLRRQG